MHRCDNANSSGTAISAQGATVAVYRNESIGNYPATQGRVEEMNAIQEEIANVIEAEGLSMLSDTEPIASMNTLNTAIENKLKASRIENDSTVGGAFTDAALDTLSGAITTVNNKFGEIIITDSEISHTFNGIDPLTIQPPAVNTAEVVGSALNGITIKAGENTSEWTSPSFAAANVNIEGGEISNVLAINAAPGSVIIKPGKYVGTASNMALVVAAGSISIISAGIEIEVTATGINITGLPTTSPGANGAFTQTGSELGGTGTTKVLCIG